MFGMFLNPFIDLGIFHKVPFEYSRCIYCDTNHHISVRNIIVYRKNSCLYIQKHSV